MCAVARWVAEAVDERLLAILEVLRVRELAGVVHDLVHDLWDANGVGRWAFVAGEGAATGGIGDVGHVVGAVEVDL